MRGFAAIGLNQPKNIINIGGVMRAAGCYQASMVAVSGTRYQKNAADTQSAHRHIPLVTCEDLRLVIPYGAVPVAVDLIEGATSLVDYKHPESAFYIFGAEDQTLGENVLSFCRDVVYVPTAFCMNLAATVNVVLYDRAAKMYQKDQA